MPMWQNAPNASGRGEEAEQAEGKIGPIISVITRGALMRGRAFLIRTARQLAGQFALRGMWAVSCMEKPASCPMVSSKAINSLRRAADVSPYGDPSVCTRCCKGESISMK